MAKRGAPPSGSPHSSKAWACDGDRSPPKGTRSCTPSRPPFPASRSCSCYGHYDVQPPEPLDEWISPPFEPTVRDGNIFARGATDDKGQMLTHVKSVEAWIKSVGKLPLQVKFLIEGEEEVGSEHLEPFVKANREKLACDAVVISDCSQFAPGIPAITYGLRGIAYYELRLRGPKQDLHSGTFGGAVTNPANALVALAGRTRKTKTAASRSPASTTMSNRSPNASASEYRALPLDRRRVHAIRSASQACSAKRLHLPRTPLGPADLRHQRPHQRLPRRRRENRAARQSEREVQLPPRARIKIRKRSTKSLRKFLEERLPPGIQMELVDHHGAPGVVVPLDSPYMRRSRRPPSKPPSAERRSSSAKAARSRSSTHSPANLAPTCCSSAGAKTTTTPTAPTKNFPSTTTTAAHSPAPACGNRIAKLAPTEKAKNELTTEAQRTRRKID